MSQLILQPFRCVVVVTSSMRRPISPRTSGDPGQSDHQLRGPPADPAWVPRRQWRAVEGDWLRRRRRRRWLRPDTDIRRLLLQPTYLRLRQSTQFKWLHFRRITGSKFNLHHLRCSAANWSRWREPSPSFRGGGKPKIKDFWIRRNNTLPEPDYIKANTKIGCNVEFRPVNYTNVLTRSLSRAP